MNDLKIKYRKMCRRINAFYFHRDRSLVKMKPPKKITARFGLSKNGILCVLWCNYGRMEVN